MLSVSESGLQQRRFAVVECAEAVERRILRRDREFGRTPLPESAIPVTPGISSGLTCVQREAVHFPDEAIA